MAGIIVVGASHGGVNAFRDLVAGLPRDFPVPIVAVLHVGSSSSILPSILNDVGGLPVSHARTGDRLERGHIHVAPPDHHLIVVDGELELTRAPRENWARPALDPLFRSAAHVFGPEAVGVVLTGMLNDGTAGLYEIKRQGGIAIVQDPDDAESPSMPKSALQHVKVDYTLPLTEIPKVLVKLAERKPAEVQAAKHSGKCAMEREHHTAAHPFAQTCPECGGAMREEKLGTLSRFRCHTGHMMTREVLVAAQLEQLQHELESLLRTVNERRYLCRDIAATYDSIGKADMAEAWRKAAEQSGSLESMLRPISEQAWIRPESDGR